MPCLQTSSKAMEGKATLPTTLAGPTVPSTGELKAVGHGGLGDTIAQNGFDHCNHGVGPSGGHSAPWTCSMSPSALLLACPVDMDEDPCWVWVLGPLQSSAGTWWWWPGTNPPKASQKQHLLYETEVS